MAGQWAQSVVFAPEVPAIHTLIISRFKDVDARHKAGHDNFNALFSATSGVHV
jgi:hypothetical protein